MRLSRLRLQLGASFALVFLVGLGAADAALFRFLERGADRNLTAGVGAGARGVAQNIRAEVLATNGTVVSATTEVLGEWAADSNGYMVYDSAGAVIGSRGVEGLREHVPPAALLPDDGRVWDAPLDAEGALRLGLARIAPAPGVPPFAVVALRSTANLREAGEQLALWLAFSAPMIVLLALVGGYFLSGVSLRPVREMTGHITAIAPGDFDRRLPVRAPPDELDTLAEQFNLLLERLAVARARNQRFLAQAAHQLRTPLTVIRGETGLGLDRPRTQDEYRDLLRRVSLAAEQMTHRVEDLFLLAQAEAGDHPALTDRVDLDGLVLDCVDMMRGRAGALGRRLELATMDHAEVRGNEMLLREGVMELLENACRHGAGGQPIRVATLRQNGVARITIASDGGPLPERPAAPASREDQGLGLSIVRWIAAVHGGSLSHRHEQGENIFTLELSARPA